MDLRKKRNNEKGNKQQALIEQKMRDGATIDPNGIKSAKCLNGVLSTLTGKENYKEEKDQELARQKRLKEQLERELLEPKEKRPFKKIRLPEEIKAEENDQ